MTTTAPVIPLAIHVVARDADGRPVPVRRGPGRPRKVRPAPSADEADYDAAVCAAREAHVEADAVVRASELRDRTLDLTWAVLREVAREAAAIAYEIQRRPDSREAERARSRRVDALVRVAQLRLEIEKADDGFAPHVVARVVRLLVDGIGEVAGDCLGPEKTEVLMARFEERARAIASASTGGS